MIRFSLLKHLSRFPLILICTLVAIGLLMLYSAANGSLHPWVTKQAWRFGVGCILMMGVAITDSRYWFACAYTLYVVALILLVAVETLGFVGMGAQRWIDLYAFSLQPSELMRVGLVLALARYFHGCSLADVAHLRALVVPGLMILFPTLLVMRQPDLGTALLLVLSSAALFFVVGVKIWKFAVAAGVTLSCIPVLWSFLHTYQQQRILTFLNPESDPMKSGYHVTQSKIALGSGGVFGKGFLQGSQSHLNFLPEKQTDFIFTMYSEEFGLVGAIILVVLYALLIAFNFNVALNARTQFGRLVAIGLTTTFFLYAFINMAMVMGFLPVVGIPLPFISYGGTALITLLVSQGLIFSIDLHKDIRVRR
ncbi:rod shape-determining protein RodA [Candidatus Finniella inopinata]|uniref:Peptidoglycan glycosyltransferase MrdB n=1 Tax=Candidatus Finniella inopinata TaxID=1696036 RepID=A0A4Q7DI80_9PROT|nr:rod shape-determining protein RodA [Candidatus Finniella inopinata]RZI45664.1 rod shape-determining protein RodA [Candidatus Finniella inopinata]